MMGVDIPARRLPALSGDHILASLGDGTATGLGDALISGEKLREFFGGRPVLENEFQLLLERFESRRRIRTLFHSENRRLQFLRRCCFAQEYLFEFAIASQELRVTTIGEASCTGSQF